MSAQSRATPLEHLAGYRGVATTYEEALHRTEAVSPDTLVAVPACPIGAGKPCPSVRTPTVRGTERRSSSPRRPRRQDHESHGPGAFPSSFAGGPATAHCELTTLGAPPDQFFRGGKDRGAPRLAR